MIALLAAMLVLQGARVDTGDGTSFEKANVVVDEKGVVVSVGTAPPPAGATVVDVSGKWITPGLFETRSALGINEVDAEPTTTDSRSNALLAPAFSVAQGFNPLSAWIPISREHGVTSALVAPRGGVLAGTAALIALTGTLQSPANPAIAMFGAVNVWAAEQAGGTRSGVWMALREALADARFYLQNKAAFEKNQARALALSPLHLEALEPVLAGRMPLVLAADRASDVLTVLEFARVEKLRVVISGGAEAWRVAKEVAAAKVPVIVRPSAQGPATFDTLAARDDLATLLVQAGVKVVISSGEDVRRLRQEAGIAVGAGLTHAQALRAVTLSPAEVFGVEASLGSLQPGRRADLVVWSGDPFELRTRAERVFIGGVEQPATNRQRRLVERYRSLPPR